MNEKKSLALIFILFCSTALSDDYLYNYRFGTSSPYGYNYDVSGIDLEGNSVSGNVDIQQKYGNGVLTN